MLIRSRVLLLAVNIRKYFLIERNVELITVRLTLVVVMSHVACHEDELLVLGWVRMIIRR